MRGEVDRRVLLVCRGSHQRPDLLRLQHLEVELLDLPQPLDAADGIRRQAVHPQARRMIPLRIVICCSWSARRRAATPGTPRSSAASPSPAPRRRTRATADARSSSYSPSVSSACTPDPPRAYRSHARAASSKTTLVRTTNPRRASDSTSASHASASRVPKNPGSGRAREHHAVKALVYIAAYAPEEGDTVGGLNLLAPSLTSTHAR